MQPTPWKVVMDGEDVARITDADGESVIETDLGAYPPYIEDAAHIVKCVNTHEALVGMLTACIRQIDEFVSEDNNGNALDNGMYIRDKALAVLATIQGGA